MAKNIKKGQTYLLHWKRNTITAKGKSHSSVKGLVIRKGQYYTKVKAKYSGNFEIVDVIYGKDTLTVHTDNLKTL